MKVLSLLFLLFGELFFKGDILLVECFNEWILLLLLFEFWSKIWLFIFILKLFIVGDERVCWCRIKFEFKIWFDVY